MQELQLYIQDQRVDLFDDEAVSITQTIQNVRDIAKVFTDFSKTFTIPASKKNNKIFKHYYNFDIVGGYDGRRKVVSNLEINYLPFRTGLVKLEGVDLKNNVPYAYRITFFGSTVSLKELLGEDKLQGLDLSAYDIDYTSAQIAAKLSANPSTNNLIVPLITHSQRLYYDSSSGAHGKNGDGNLYYDTGQHGVQGNGNNDPIYHGVKWDELKYALRVDEIIKAIENRYGIIFSNDFFNNTNEHYYNLFMWLHRKKGDVENLSGVNQSIADPWLAQIGDYDATLTKMITSSRLSVIGEPINYGVCVLAINTSALEPYAVSVQLDGVEVANTGFIVGNKTVRINLEKGEYTVLVSSEFNITFTSLEWRIVHLSDFRDYTSNIYNYVSAFQFLIEQQIPEMKILDFLTGLFKMFNLTAYVEKDVVIVKHLDDFYAGGGSYDISKYVVTDTSSVNVALPYKDIRFEHDDTNTILAKQHEQLAGKKWGLASIEGSEGKEKLDGGTYTVKTPFSQMKYERLVDVANASKKTVQVGYFVDDNQDPYYGKPLLFYPILQDTNTTEISFLQSETSMVPKTIYNIPSNSVAIDDVNNTKNINFYAENNEYNDKEPFKDTLFKVFYFNYIESVFNKSNRLTKVSAYLPLNILLRYTLADRFVINNYSYKINSITTDLTTGKSSLELLNDL